MKNNKHIIIILINSLIFISFQLKSQPFTCQPQACTPVGDPYLDYTCFATIEKYLARSIAMDDITEVNRSTYDPNCNNTNSCNPVYTQCPTGGYCPQRYCDDIQTLTQINAQFIRRAALLWGSEAKIVSPFHDYWLKSKQTVIDINKAYDCANLRRPIIQAALLEHVSDEVLWIVIPQYVKDAFVNDPDYISQINNYSNGAVFQRVNIVKFPTYNTPDLNRIEARMWFYYLATNYIDFGYKALHIGHINTMIGNDIGNSKTYTLLNKIRNYATNLPNPSFVIIDAHVDHDLYLNNTNLLLLDFNSSPIRADEILIPDGSPCQVDLNGTISVSNSCGLIGNSTGGLSPLGCYYPYTPYFLEFDHTYYPQNGGNISPSNICSNIWSTDEKTWFYNISSNQCRENIINKFYKAIRTIEYKGFLQPIGSTGIDITNNGSAQWTIGRYRLFDNPTTISSIANLWKPNESHALYVNKACIQNNWFCYPSLKVQKRNRYLFDIWKPDNSSIYSIHIQNPDGSWQPFTYGSHRTFYPTMTGQYTIYIRQDNIGLPNYLIDCKSSSYHIFLYKYCCGDNNYKVSPDEENYEGDSTVLYENDDLTEYNEYIENGLYTEQTYEMAINDSLNIYENDEHFSAKELISINDESDINVNIYPNPTNNFISIELLSSKDRDIEIVLKNMLGQTIYYLESSKKLNASNLTTLKYNIKELPNSIYFIEINAGDGIRLKYKLIKN